MGRAGGDSPREGRLFLLRAAGVGAYHGVLEAPAADPTEEPVFGSPP